MKKTLLALGLCLLAADAHAVTRLDPTRMSCDQVQSTIAREGAVILRYRSTNTPGVPVYDRYVSSAQFCQQGEGRARAFVPSANRDSCQVFKCKQLEFERRMRWWMDD